MVKGVDINLLPQWANWSQSFKRFGECQAEWKGMEPVVPSGGNSGFAVIAQDTLLRIFSHRRDYDWHEAFDVFATAKHTKWSKAYNDRLTDKEPPSKQELLAKLALNVGSVAVCVVCVCVSVCLCTLPLTSPVSYSNERLR